MVVLVNAVSVPLVTVMATFPAGWVDPYTPPSATDWNHPVKAAPPRPETDPDAP